jgi:hypothetical protein
MGLTVYRGPVQKPHRAINLALPKEWGLRWWRSDSYQIVPLDAPDSPVSRRAAGSWQWCEGVLWTRERGEAYDAVPLGPEIFDAALRVTPEDTGSILAFVRAWGPLGPSVPFDYSVWAARRTFRELQRHFAWLRALQGRNWRSPAIPNVWEDSDGLVDALRVVLPPPEHGKLEPPWPDPGYPELVREVIFTDERRDRRSYPDPYVAAFVKGQFYAWWARTGRPSDREERHWRAFGWALAEHLRRVQPMVTWGGDRPEAAWEIPHLVDLLWVQLWNLTTGGAAIRQCRRCGRWFAIDRRGKVYCSRVCTNRASAAASYQRKTATARAGRGRGR